MRRRNVTIRAVEAEAWDLLIAMRDEERRYMGAILSDALWAYWTENHAEEDSSPSA